MEQDKEQSLQVQTGLPHFIWPTSKPGPFATQPPPGQMPMPGRTDQVVEIGYNQETGRTAFDQQETAQEAPKKRKRK